MFDSIADKKKWSGKIIPFLIIIVIIVVIVRIYKATKAAANVAGQAVGNEVIATQLGMNTSRVVYIRSEAARLWDEGVKSIFWVRNYDEDMFITTINEMANNKEVMLLDQLYKEKSGERLKDAINKSFSARDKARVNAQWLAILNT